MRTYQDMVYSTAARLTGDASQAEDIAQEVFLRAHRAFAELRGNPRAGGWLKTVATNLSFTHLTRYRRRWTFFSQLARADAESDAEAMSPELAVPDAESVLANVQLSERRTQIDAALRQLPDSQRLPLVMFHFGDLPYEDIAARLRVSLPKVKTDIHRARQALVRILARMGIDASELQP